MSLYTALLGGGGLLSFPMAGAFIDYDIVNSRYYAGTTLAGFSNAITLTRTGTNATDLFAIDPAGTSFNTYAANAPRFKNGGLIIEGAVTQKSTHATAPANETFSLGNGNYMLWVNGSGSAAVSANTAVGTGFGSATQGVPLAFVITTTGTVDITITGSLNDLQVENAISGAVTSLITTGARGAESPVLSATGLARMTFPCTVLMEVEFPQINRAVQTIVRTLFDWFQDANNYLSGYLTPTVSGFIIGVVCKIAGVTTLNFQNHDNGVVGIPGIYRLAVRLESGNAGVSTSNNVTVATSATATGYPALATGYIGTLAATQNMLAILRRLIVQPSMTDANIQTWLSRCPNQSNMITAWGDSLTAGNGASNAGFTAYTPVCAALFGFKQKYINAGISGQTSSQISARQTSDLVAVAGINIFWSGRNNVADQPQVMTSTAAMVAHQTSGKFVVFGVTTKYDGTEDTGSANNTAILAINSALAAAYPNNYIDVLTLGIAASGGSNGHINPTWGNGDGTHYNDTMYAWLGGEAHNFILAKGWL